MTPRDKRAIADLTKEFDIDFVALTYTCSAEDVVELRQYLDSLGRESIRIIAKVFSQPVFCRQGCHHVQTACQLISFSVARLGAGSLAS